MTIHTVNLPEPYLGALAAGRLREVADAAADGSAALFGRAVARMFTGREADARADLAAALPGLGDAARIELAFLDVRQRSAVRDALVVATEIAARLQTPPPLRARALHVAGLAQGKLRQTAASVGSLLSAAELYLHLGDTAGHAAAYDTLGGVQAARGKLDEALHFFAMSLVDKCLTNDRMGMAITLGNIGRVHLRAGRLSEARQCFERDLLLATEMGDERGQARMHDDLGRTRAAAGELDAADRAYSDCLAIAERRDYADLRFFARKDLALLRVEQGRLAEARAELDAARAALPAGGEPYFALVLLAAEGELQQARGEAAAVETLERAVAGFVEADLPDLEIPARITLARALLGRRLKATAERCIVDGLRRARAGGYARYVRLLGEEMARLDLTEGAVDETPRPIGDAAAGQDAEAGGGYLVRQRLGGGAFGEVFRAYDPQRGLEVAIKRLRLGRLYDVRKRKQFIASARLEIEAASRVRHPGVVRVLAVGFDEAGGGMYVVQEFVDGQSLRELMDRTRAPDPRVVLRYVEQVAGALQALHDAGVVHRDLKPANIIVRPDGLPVVIDLGVAHLGGADLGADEPEGPRRARSITGTLAYMAPEQAQGRAVDGRADLYSLGVIAYEWLAGTRPLVLGGGALKEVVNELLTRAPRPLAEARPELSPAVSKLVMRLLAKRALVRPPQASDLADACAKLLAGGELLVARPAAGAALPTVSEPPASGNDPTRTLAS